MNEDIEFSIILPVLNEENDIESAIFESLKAIYPYNVIWRSLQLPVLGNQN